MKQYIVGILIEGGGNTHSDNTLVKTVYADNEVEGLNIVKNLLKVENPEINGRKIWSWHIEQISEFAVF